MNCIECEKEFKPYDSRQKFCSKSCGAIFNNRRRHGVTVKSPKNKGRNKCSCGLLKHNKAITCFLCLKHNKCKDWLEKPISALIGGRTKGPHRFNELRSHARKMMKYFGGEYKCSLCNFNVCLHVDHRKPVTDFKETDLIKEVNGLQNLRFLCPNHHAMVTKGLIE